MEKTVHRNRILQAERAITQGALHDLKTLLNDIKGRTIFLSHNLTVENQMKVHFQEILSHLNTSLDTADLLTDAFEVECLPETRQ